MRTLNLTLICLLLWSALAAQKTREEKQARDQLFYNGKLFAKLNFFSLLDPQTPTIQPSVEYRFSPEYRVEFTIGIPVRWHENAKPTDSTYNRYYKLKAGLRYYPNGKFFYIGPELFFVRKSQSRWDDVFQGKDRIDYVYDYAELRKNIFGAAFVVGNVFPLAERVSIDASISAGPRFVHLRVNSVNPTEAIGYRWLYWVHDREGTRMGIHLNASCKLVYMIK